MRSDESSRCPVQLLVLLLLLLLKVEHVFHGTRSSLNATGHEHHPPSTFDCLCLSSAIQIVTI